MSTVASTLLDFIIGLFRDPEKAAAYAADPQGVLDAAGLPDATPQEVADLLPMVSDFATVGGWSDGGRSERGEDGSGDRCDGGEGRTGGEQHSPRPVDDEDEDPPGGVARVDREEGDRDEDAGPTGGGHHHAPAPAGGTETVVITHLQEVHHTHTETTVEIDASHSIWVSGDAQAIFGDVRGDVTQIDNEGGIVAGDDVEDSWVDTSDRSVRDSHDTVVDVDLEDSPVNLGGSQAVDSFTGNEDNDVVADRGGQVGDNTSVRVDDVTVVTDSEDVGNTTTVTDSYGTDNSIEDSFNGNDLSQDNDGVDDSFNGNENVGNDHSDNSATDNSVEDSFNGNDLSDDDGVDDSFNGSLNGNDLSDDDGVDDSFTGNDLSEDNDVATEDNDVAVVRNAFEDSFNSDDDGVDDSLNGNAVAVDHAEAEAEDVTVG